MMSYMFYAPTRVLFGAGQLSKLHEQTMPGKKAMLVISNGKSTWMSGALDRTTEQLRAAGVEMALFDKVGANPLKSIVEEGADFARSNGCDFVVALGGGSVMDAAKVMAMYAPQPGDLWDYVPGATGKMQPFGKPRPSLGCNHHNGGYRLRGGPVGRGHQSGNQRENRLRRHGQSVPCTGCGRSGIDGNGARQVHGLSRF